jgi:predicted ATPase/class 3 adenylate cyclase
MHLPTGTITFLFTDIEGSTKLWENHPEEMRVALAQHDMLLRQVIEANGGTVFKTVGDAFCAAFDAAPSALAAAVEAQLRHSQAQGPVLLRIRLALHTGIAEQRDADYFGPPLNRIARLLSTAHGGQMLLSAATYELVRDHLPSGVSLKALGTHRLKDLERPEQVFQIIHPALPEAFPPLRSLDMAPNNLPQQLTSFIGREKEIAAVGALLRKTRLLMLTGSGGSGKTRLALQCAADRTDDYPDGVWLVELAPLTDTTQVTQAVASALSIREQPGQSLPQSLTAALKSKKLLLLLDNCEHLLECCTHFVAALLRTCPDIGVLATSREPLGIAGEVVYRIPSLSIPAPKQASAATVQSLNQYEAVQLFIERALSVKPDFAITNSNAPALAQLCHHLDGIPLALELAAARVRSLSLEEINDKLDKRFRLLTGGDKSALPRQQTLRALVDWSYDLLNDTEQLLFARLSVFAGGWTLAAAEAVCGFPPIADFEILDILTGLVDKSLVQVEETGGESRYGMLETLRQYAAEKREERGETTFLRERHQKRFLALAEETEPLLARAEQAVWLNHLETEHDNLRTALVECPAETALRLSRALSRFWQVRGYLTEGRQQLEKALNQARSTPIASTIVMAKALNTASDLAKSQGDLRTAQSLSEESLTLSRHLDDKRSIASALNSLGTIIGYQGNPAAASAWFEESLSLWRELNDVPGIAATLNNLGIAANDQGDYATARTLYEESLILRRKLGDKRGIMLQLNNISNPIHELSGPAAARPYLEESLQLAREIGDKNGIANALLNLGQITHKLGDLATARDLYIENLLLRRELGDTKGIAASLESFSTLLLQENNARKAAVLWGATHALRESSGAALMPIDIPELDTLQAEARSQVGEEEFLSAWKEGRGMSWEQAIHYALNERSAE